MGRSGQDRLRRDGRLGLVVHLGEGSGDRRGADSEHLRSISEEVSATLLKLGTRGLPAKSWVRKFARALFTEQASVLSAVLDGTVTARDAVQRIQEALEAPSSTANSDLQMLRPGRKDPNVCAAFRHPQI